MFLLLNVQDQKIQLSMGKVYIFLQPYVREHNYGYIYVSIYIFATVRTVAKIWLYYNQC